MYSSALKPFVLNPNDVSFILDQVNFRPLFDALGNALVNWNGSGAIYDGHHNLIWDGVSNQAADGFLFYAGGDSDEDGDTDAADLAFAATHYFGTSYATLTSLTGLRDVQGWNNNLNLNRSEWGRVDQPFLRTVDADYGLNSHGHTYVAGETTYVTGTDQNGAGVLGSAFWANKGFGSLVGNTIVTTPGFTVPTGKSTDYAITDLNNDGAIQNNELSSIVDYTPRMISRLITTGGVTFATTDGQHIDYGTTGTAQVTDWGLLGSADTGGLGIQDAQARFAGTPGTIEVAPGVFEGEYFVAAQNPGVSPTNGWFTIFGQFFDHGLDFIDKGGQGKAIKISFAADDPLYGEIGPDGRPATAITISRATVDSFDAAGNPQYLNHTSPFIDQSQSYGSHDEVTLLLREWVEDPLNPGTFIAGMNLLDGHTLATQWTRPDGTLTNQTLPTLNELRQHVIETDRAALTWEDVLNYHGSGQSLILDMNPRFDNWHLLSPSSQTEFDLNKNGVVESGESLATNVYSQVQALNAYVKGVDPASSFGFTMSGPAEGVTYVLTLNLSNEPGNPWGPYAGQTFTGANALALWVNFSNMSIGSRPGTPADLDAGLVSGIHDAVAAILMASVGDHYIAGDGRVNENFGLTTVHHVFHEEHNFQVDNLIGAIMKEADARVGRIGDNTYDAEYMKGFQNWDSPGVAWNAATGNYEVGGKIAWDFEKMFLATKLVVEMEYQHVAIDQYARTVTPDIKEFVGYTAGENPAVSLEYAQSIFRFGHSQLRETIDTIDPDHGLTGKITGYALKLAFLEPGKFADIGPGAIALGMTHQQGNEIDELITPALNQGLLGQPLDLAAINIARGRDAGIPALNEFRKAVGLQAYTGWADFGANMIHPDNLVNFIAAYSFDGNLDKANALLELFNGAYADNAAALLLAGTLGLAQGSMTNGEFEAYANDFAFNFMTGGDRGIDAVDTWIGGLAEIHVTGGLLGETFNLVFVDQMERIQDGDRFYYLYRLAGQQFADEIGGGQFKDIIERNTGLTHLGGSAFSYNDQYYDLSANREVLVGAGETNTVNNNHKYGNVVDQDGNPVTTGTEANKLGAVDGVGALTRNNNGSNLANNNNENLGKGVGIYTDGQGSANLDGQLTTRSTVNPITGATVTLKYIRDTRLADPNAPNGGAGIDGAPNSGAESAEVIVGTQYGDVIRARSGDDTVYGEGGDDIIFGDNGIDRLYGGDGKDWLFGGEGAELSDGGAGDDFITGDSSTTAAAGVDQLMGGMGNDYISGGVGIDKLAGGGGDDVIYGEGDTDPFTHGGDGNDYIDGGISGDNLYGDNGDDVIVGAADQDILYGGNGDDILRPGDPSQAIAGGPDEVLGGDGTTDNGFDIIDFSDNGASAVGIVFDLTNQANPQVQIDGNTPVPAAAQIEGIVGSQNNDTLTGDNDVESAKGSWLVGGSGNDTLTSGMGNDIIIGGSMRLDDMIGRFDSGYTHNNNNDNANATGLADIDANGVTQTYTQEQMDYLYQGASHRVAWDDTLDNSGLIDEINSQTQGDGTSFDKHFTEMLRTEMFKDMSLGDVAGQTTAGTDTVVFAGNVVDYVFEAISFVDHAGNTHSGLAVTDSVSGRDGSDAVLDVANYSFADGTYTLTQLTPPDVSVSDVSVNEGDSGVTSADFTIQLSSAFMRDIEVSYSTSDTTAANPGDYTSTNGTVTIPAGSTSVTISVPVNGDTQFELNETFQLNLTAADQGANIVDSLGLGTIVNDDAMPSLSIGDVSHSEGNAGTTAYTFTVALSAPAGVPVTVNWETADGSATLGSDYGAASGSLTFAPGEASQTVTVLVNGENIVEADETFSVTLSSPVNATLGTSTATGSIVNDDFPPSDIQWNGIAPVSGIALPVTGDPLANLASTDVNPGAFSYELTSQSPGANFAIDTGGAVTLPGALATGTSYSLQIKTTNTSTGISRTETMKVVTGSNLASTMNHSASSNDTVVYALGGNDNVITGAGNDTLYGGGGSDSLNGGAGDDAMHGGAGNDIYFVDNAGDTVVEDALGGIDTVYTTLNSYTLSSNVEGMRYSGTGAFTGNGNSINNDMAGGDGSDTLNGAGGSDSLMGRGGDDTLNGDTGFDRASWSGAVGNFTFAANGTSILVTDTVGSEGTDTLNSIEGIRFGGTGGVTYNVVGGTNGNNPSLNGGGGGDAVFGFDGDDRLNGGGGQDVLFGGTGSDSFGFTTANHSGIGAAARDLILDFTQGADLIDLGLIDANASAVGNQSFNWIGSVASGTVLSQGEAGYYQDGGHTYVVANTSASLLANTFEIDLVGNLALASTDFIL